MASSPPNARQRSPPTAATHEEFTILETLYRDARTTVLPALRRDGGSVVLKVLDPRGCREKDLVRLRREYEMGVSLDLDSAVRPCGLETYEGMPALVLEDFGGEPLERLAMPMPPERFLDLAARVAGAVAEVHGRGVIHKDLNPANILVDPTALEVKIADFGIATRLRREQQAAHPPPLIEGTFPYMSPEQTGRMNRALDCRSDLYSLGVTFYRMLTGRLPFEARDPLEWVHCHVARVPRSPEQIVPDVPELIAKIVMKLLAKMPEDRYQTARGLQYDLTRCLEQWRKSGHIDPFPLGERDVPDRLQIPQKLYGRDQEIDALLAAFERVAGTAVPELVPCRATPASASRRWCTSWRSRSSVGRGSSSRASSTSTGATFPTPRSCRPSGSWCRGSSSRARIGSPSGGSGYRPPSG